MPRWRSADKEGHAVMLVGGRAELVGRGNTEVGRWSRAVKRFEDSPLWGGGGRVEV